MANTFQGLMQNLSNDRNTIKDKLVEMGLTVAEPGKLSDVADTAQAITVDAETTEIAISAGQTFRLEPGNYYAKEVSITSATLDIANTYFTGSDIQNLTASVSIPYTVQAVWENGQQNLKIIATPQTVSAPEGYTFRNVAVTEVTSNNSISKSYVNAQLSETGKTITFTISGNTSPGANAGTAVITYSYERVTDYDTGDGTPVTPTTEVQHFYAETGKVMTAFTVGAIQTEEKDVSSADIITNKDGKGTLYPITPSDGKYITSVDIGKVVIDSATVDADTLYNNTTENLVVTAESLGYDGISSISIPRPAGVTVNDADTNIDLLTLELEEDKDHVITIPAGYYMSSTEITLRTDALYDELATI